MKERKEQVDILIVDDREDGLIALEAVLSHLPNIRLVRARSGIEAIRILPEYDFAVILLDVQMPELDGFETAKLLRHKYEKYRLTPIIFVTAINKDDHYIIRGYEAGAVDYVFKPFDPHNLKSKVSVFIDLYLKNKQLQLQAEIIRESERRERYLKLAELELESLKRYRSLADAIPHIVWKAKPDGTLDYFNKVWMDYTGLSSDQSIGSGWQNAIHNEDIGMFLKTWINAMVTSDSFEVECRIKRRDGEMRWHWVRAVPETRSEGVVSWLGTCTDIHDRKLSEVKLQHAQQEAIAANKAKTNFLANMSHEIRTPMGAILGFTELMLNPEQTTEQRAHCISTIQRNGKQLLTIIDEILDISKVEAGQLSVESIPLTLPSLLADVRNLLVIQAENKALNLVFDLKSVIPETIFSDPTRIRQILTNMVGNAIKFTNQGEIHVEIEWKKAEDSKSGLLRLRVIDSGLGIDNSNASRLFLPFSQVDSSTSRQYGGTGLGLALSKRLARALGGDVSLESSVLGKGSVFLIELNVKLQSPVKWVEKLAFTRIDLRKPYQKDNEKKLTGVNILLVDDAPDNQTIIDLFLSSAGASVEFADNGEEGVTKALSGDYNIVLMDIQMPHLDGYQATKILRQQGYNKPIIALTAHAFKEERERCLQAGCTEHFTKPVDKARLISLVDKVVHDLH